MTSQEEWKLRTEGQAQIKFSNTTSKVAISFPGNAKFNSLHGLKEGTRQHAVLNPDQSGTHSNGFGFLTASVTTLQLVPHLPSHLHTVVIRVSSFLTPVTVLAKDSMSSFSL